MFEKIGSALKKATDKIASAIFVDVKLIEEIVKDLEKALIGADVNVQLVKKLGEELKQAAKEKIKGVEKKEHILKLLHDKLMEMLGEGGEFVIKKSKKKKIMLIGLYGAGKTTTVAKLANYYQKRGLKTCMLGLDVHRPAAPEQLEQLAKKHKLTAFIDKEEKNPEKIYEKFQKQIEKCDLTIIDTAGRHSLDKNLISELKSLNKKIKPTYTILVMPADIGQSAKQQASEFQKTVNIDGVIITRMDSSAKGGGALTACSETNAKVFFIATGEKINDLETFSSKRFISRILGMGDLEALMEKVSSVIDEKKSKKIEEKFKAGKFTMDDMFEQLESMQQIGTFGKIAELIPGLGKLKTKLPEGMLDTQEAKMKKWRFIIQSMTPEEKENPELLEKQTTRIQRIAKGSGTATSDVRSLIKQHKLLKEFAKTGEQMDLSQGLGGLNPQQLQKLAKKFGKKIKLK